MKNEIQIKKEFTQVLEQYKALIFKIASSYCNQGEDINDLVQEIALQLWRSYPGYNSKYALSTWIYRIALNTSISFVRKQKNKERHISQYASEPQILSLEDDHIKEKLKSLYQLIEALKPMEKAMIIMHLEECPNSEIAEVFGISISNVSTRLNRIRTKLIKLNQEK